MGDGHRSAGCPAWRGLLGRAGPEGRQSRSTARVRPSPEDGVGLKEDDGEEG